MLVSDKKLTCIEVVMYTCINGQAIVARAVVFHKTAFAPRVLKGVCSVIIHHIILQWIWAYRGLDPVSLLY